MRECELAVLGSGFWGTACALKARQAGVETVVIDDDMPMAASRAAAGMIHPEWFKGATIGKLLPPGWDGAAVGGSIAWLTQYGLKASGELFSGPAGERRRPDVFMLDSVDGFLELAHPTRASVTHLRRTAKGWRVFIRFPGDMEYSTVETKQVIVALGCGTDRVLEASSLPTVGVKRMRGRALIVKAKGVNVPSLPYRFQTKPYTSWTLRPWENGRLRFGDTTEPDEGKRGAIIELNTQLQKVVFDDYEVDAIADGFRPVCDVFTVRALAPGLVVATGGHRVGLGVAGLAADSALKLLSARFM